jgi:hypothetical protein
LFGNGRVVGSGTVLGDAADGALSIINNVANCAAPKPSIGHHPVLPHPEITLWSVRQ